MGVEKLVVLPLRSLALCFAMPGLGDTLEALAGAITTRSLAVAL